MGTPITVEQLLELVERSSRDLTICTDPDTPEWMRTGETIRYIDSNDLRDGLQAILDARPEVVFAELVGMEGKDAVAFINNRAPYLKEQHPVEQTIPILDHYYNPSRPASDYANKPGCLILRVQRDGKVLGIIGIS